MEDNKRGKQLSGYSADSPPPPATWQQLQLLALKALQCQLAQC
jgi:hypothetical protein